MWLRGAEGSRGRCRFSREEETPKMHPDASRLSLFLVVITGAGDGIGKAYSFEVRRLLFMVWIVEVRSCLVAQADLKGFSCLSFPSS